MKMKSKGLLTIFALFAVVILTIFTARNYFIGQKYRTTLEYSYARAMGDLSDSLSEMTNALEKTEYCATSTMQLEVSAAIIAAGGTAKSAAAALPFSVDRSAKIEKLISVCEDYALYTAKKISAGSNFSDTDFNNFKSMSQYVKELSDSVIEIRAKLDENNTKISKTESMLNQTLNIPDAPDFDDGLKTVADDLDAFPTMLYDGPFSDHVQQMESKYLKGKNEISQDDAIKIAADFLDVDSGNLHCDYSTDGTLAAYQVRGEGMSVNVTKQGGEISWVKRAVDVPETKMTYEDALKKAKEFLSKNKLGEVKESYYAISDNTCTINFSAVQDNVIMYPDLIKVTVELNEGGIIEYNAEGYLMNHTERSNLTPKLTETEAASDVSKSLKVKNTAVAIIPTSGKNEVLTYEFTCESADGTEILVYINAETGFEQQVYILEKSDNGVLVV